MASTGTFSCAPAGDDLIARSNPLPGTFQPDYGLPYWQCVVSRRRARGWLCLVGSMTILAGFLIGSDYAISMEFLKSLAGLALVIAGILYLSCARRMERGGRLPGLLALGVASLQTGALMIVAFLVAREMIMWEWHLEDPLLRGMALDTEPNWALVWVILALTAAFTCTMGALILHITRFLSFARK